MPEPQVTVRSTEAGRVAEVVVVRYRFLGDGDPLEWGRRLPCGCMWVHPPWGPACVAPNRFFGPVSLPWWRRLLRRRRRPCAHLRIAAGRVERVQ